MYGFSVSTFFAMSSDSECSLLKGVNTMIRMRFLLASVVLLLAPGLGAQQLDPPRPVPVTAPAPPFPNRANEVLPSWLRVRGEFRERIEGFTGAGFTTSATICTG